MRRGQWLSLKETDIEDEGWDCVRDVPSLRWSSKLVPWEFWLGCGDKEDKQAGRASMTFA